MRMYRLPADIELVINQKTGEAFATISGYARMSGLNKSTISRRSQKLVAPEAIKTSEIDTGYGFKVVALIPADIVFDWLCDDNLPLAKAMGKAGATLYMHKIAGFKLPSTEKATPTVESSLTDKELLKTFTDLYARATRTGNKRLLLIAENNIADIAEKINPGSDSYDDAQPVYSDLTPIEKFMLKEVVVTNNHADKLSSLQLYTAFVKWQGSASVSRSKFTKSVRTLQKGTFHEKIRSGGIRTSGFTGIKFVNN